MAIIQHPAVASNGVSVNGSGDLVDSNGNVITGQATYTLAQFQAGGFDLTTARYVRVTDLHSSVSGFGGSLWFIDPTATQKRILISEPVVFATIALLVASFPAATYPYLRSYVTEWNTEFISNGTRYVPATRLATLFNLVYGTLAAPTVTVSAGTTFTFNATSFGAPTLPAGTLATGDKLILTGKFQRHGAVGTINPLRVTLGTAGTSSDAVIWSNTIAATDLVETNFLCVVDIGSSTNFTSNSSAAMDGAGGVGQLVAGTANFDVASALIFSVNGTKAAGDSIDLLAFHVQWVV